MNFNTWSIWHYPHITRDAQGEVEWCTLQWHRRYYFHFDIIKHFIHSGIICSDLIDYCDNTLFVYTNRHFGSNYQHKTIEEINNLREKLLIDKKYNIEQDSSAWANYWLERVQLWFLTNIDIYNMYCKQNFTSSTQSL